MKRVFSILAVLALVAFTPQAGNASENLEMATICPGTVQILVSVPQNCVSTAHAVSQNSTGANWTISGGTILSGQGTSTITFTAGFMGGNVTLTARAFNDVCYSPNTASRTVYVDCN